jgi:uncharacterized protein YjbI with pentapeptide repeats
MIQLGSTACADSQRVPPSPSTALAAAVNAVLAVTGRPCDTNTGGQLVQPAELELAILLGATELGATLLRELLSGVLEGAMLEGATLLGATELRLLLATLDGGAIELLLVVDDEVPTVAGASLLYAMTRKLSK